MVNVKEEQKLKWKQQELNRRKQKRNFSRCKLKNRMQKHLLKPPRNSSSLSLRKNLGKKKVYFQ
jgi:hypothetical protein